MGYNMKGFSGFGNSPSPIKQSALIKPIIKYGAKVVKKLKSKIKSSKPTFESISYSPSNPKYVGKNVAVELPGKIKFKTHPKKVKGVYKSFKGHIDVVETSKGLKPRGVGHKTPLGHEFETYNRPFVKKTTEYFNKLMKGNPDLKNPRKGSKKHMTGTSTAQGSIYN